MVWLWILIQVHRKTTFKAYLSLSIASVLIFYDFLFHIFSFSTKDSTRRKLETKIQLEILNDSQKRRYSNASFKSTATKNGRSSFLYPNLVQLAPMFHHLPKLIQ